MIISISNGVISGTLKNAVSSYIEEVTGTINGSQMTLKVHTNNNYVTCTYVPSVGGWEYNIDETYNITGTTDANLSFYNATFQLQRILGNPQGNPCTPGPPQILNSTGTFTW
jgi:hypothetical protein